MDKLISELTRLYLPPGSPPPRADGGACSPVDLVAPDGSTRAIVIAFRKRAGEDGEHWQRLCDVANLLQREFEFPAPSVSVASAGGYLLWLSLAAPVPLADARRFLERFAQVHTPDLVPPLQALADPVELPPALNRHNGRWAAFIHPGMGASFADESGLDMPPPAAGQLAFVEGLRSISLEQFRAALDKLGAAPVAAPAPRPAREATAGLLLKDATLEDIVRELQARHVEPIFRFLLP